MEGVSCLHDLWHLWVRVWVGVGVCVCVRVVCVDVDVDVCLGMCFYVWYWGRRRWEGPTGEGRQVVQFSRTTQVAVVGQHSRCVWWVVGGGCVSVCGRVRVYVQVGSVAS